MQMKGVQILNFMGSSNRRVLIYQEMDEVETKDTVDIVLTPQFYIFLKEELEIKFAYQAKNIAPAFFDDYLNDDLSYQYYVYKYQTEWYFFAYSVDEITTFLEGKGIASHQIGKIYFIQELEELLEQPIELGNLFAMKSLDGVVTVLPRRIIGSDVKYQQFHVEREKFQQGITISSAYDSIVPFKETAFLGSLLFILGTSFIFDGMRGGGSIESMNIIKDEMIEEYPRLSSSFQRNSELKKYTKIDKEERAKREMLMQISKMISPRNRLKSLTFDGKKVIAIIMLDSINSLQKIKKITKEKHFELVIKAKKEIVVEKSL